MKPRKPFLKSNLFACLLAFAAMATFAGLVWVKFKPESSSRKSTAQNETIWGAGSDEPKEVNHVTEAESPEELAARRKNSFLESNFRGLKPFVYDEGFSTYIVRSGIGLHQGQDGTRRTTRCLVYEKHEGALIMVAVYPLGSERNYSILHYVDADLRTVNYPVFVAPERVSQLADSIQQFR